MKNGVFYLLLLSCVLLFPVTSIGQDSMNVPCTVKLKKGKALIIRDQDGNRLPGTLPNGASVTAVEMADGEGPGAAKIAVNRKGKRVVLGWVSQANLNCRY